MLSKENLIKDAEKEYIPMLKEVNIPDFTKCIAQFSGLHINEVCDDVIKTYLLTWAKNKYRFYQMFGNGIKIDVPIQYDSQELNVEAKMNEIRKEYPAYALWLDDFKRFDKNKISMRHLSYSIERVIAELFPHCNLEGATITHFFKKYLQAPDELITALGRIWENQKIEGTYTISIDPVDMMFASENPYNWTSCYRLEVDNSDSHADGCLAAMLDDSSLITYVWNHEGKFSLYDNYDFKNIRYFRMRQWISIAPSGTAIHFNKIYPGKSYSSDFEKQLREIVENLVNKEAIWTHNIGYYSDCIRKYPYGYNEFSYDYIYKIKDSEDTTWEAYNEKILCPCGCGDYLPGNDTGEDVDDYNYYNYNGEGFINENFYLEEPEGEYCTYIDDYCTDTDCENCSYWNENNPVCELDPTETCNNAGDADSDCFDAYESNIVSCGKHCEGCPLHAKLCEEEEEMQTSLVKVGEGIKTVACTAEQLKNSLLSLSDKITIKNANDLSSIDYYIDKPQAQGTLSMDLDSGVAVWHTYPDEDPQTPRD